MEVVSNTMLLSTLFLILMMTIYNKFFLYMVGKNDIIKLLTFEKVYYTY